MTHTSVTFTAALLALCPQAPEVCTHSTYDNSHGAVTPPGSDPDSETFAECGSTSFSVNITISAGGEIHVVEAGASGALTISMSTPPKCPTQRIEYSGEIIPCKDAGTLPCWTCDPKGDFVKVKLFQNFSPCPNLPPADLMGVLEAAADSLANGAELTIPCNELKDVTDEKLDENSRVRATARTHRCEPCDPPSPSDDRLDCNQYFEVGSAVLFNYQGSLQDLDLGNILGSASLDEFGQAIVPQELRDLLAAQGNSTIPPELSAVSGEVGSLAWLDDVICEVKTTYPAEDGDGQPVQASRSFTVYGDFRSNGDFSLMIPETLRNEDGEKVTINEHWTCSQGDLFFCEEGDLAGVVYPMANGASEIAYSSSLWFTRDLLAWLRDPLATSGSPAMTYEVLEQNESLLRVERRLAWSYASGVAPSYEADWLLGGRWEYEIDTTGEQPRLVRTRCEGANGQVEVREFSRWIDVRGELRPAALTIKRLSFTGELERTTTYSFTSFDRSSADPSELPMPTPRDQVWYVRVE